tara:strand:- start:117 stop:260 length:144 start_codon:yes stop_codon:yes gene_type:complete
MSILNKGILLSGLGVDPSSGLGLLIIFIGLIITIGLPVVMITKGKKD